MPMNNILFTTEGKAKTPDEIHEKVIHFKYTDATHRTI